MEIKEEDLNNFLNGLMNKFPGEIKNKAFYISYYFYKMIGIKDFKGIPFIIDLNMKNAELKLEQIRGYYENK